MGQIGKWKSGRWINMGYVKSWYLPGKEQQLWLESSEEWELCLEPTAECLRYAKWRPL